MLQEIERAKFRLGESANKPIGGNIADTPFVKALRAVAVDRGFESQRSLARALGHNSSDRVGKYYRGQHVPSPEAFGELLILFCSTKGDYDDKSEALVDAYAQEITRGKGVRYSRKDVLEQSRRQIKPSDTPIGGWIENTVQELGITIRELSRTLGVNNIHRDLCGLLQFNDIEKNVGEAPSLSPAQKESLSEAIRSTVRQRQSEGHIFQTTPRGSKIRQIQKQLGYITYNGVQVAREFGVTRQTTSNWRKKRNWLSPLTERQMEILRQEEMNKRKYD